jgi:hypothetical protein
MGLLHILETIKVVIFYSLENACLSWGRIDSVSAEYRPELLVLIRYVATVSGSLTLGLLQVVVVIGLFFVAPVIVVGGQIAFFQLVEKLGEVEADQSCIGDSDANVRDVQPSSCSDGPLSPRIEATERNERGIFSALLSS